MRSGGRAVLDLALAVAVVQGNDLVGAFIDQMPDALEKAHPEHADIAGARIHAVVERLVAAFGDPAGLGQVDLALLGVDPVLAEQELAAPQLLENATHQSGVAGGNRVQHPGPWHVPGGIGQHQQGRLHGAQGPEVVDEGRIGAMLLVAFGQCFPAGPAVEHVVQGDAPLGQGCQHFDAQLGGGLLRVVQVAVQVAQFLQGRAMGLALVPGVAPGLFQVHLFDMHHVGRNLIAALPIGLALAANEQHRKLQLRQAEDHLVDPAGHATTHIGPGALEQQADIGDGG